MRHIKAFDQLFESQQVLTQMQKDWLDECMAKMAANRISRIGGSWSVNPQTGLVDIDGDFWVPRKSLTDFRGVRFGRVSGFFNCSSNNLTSLEGAPQEVGGVFYCNGNQLTSLEGAPQQVEWDFDCSGNQLTSLDGAPQRIGENFNCSYNSLTSLEGGPLILGGFYNCARNSLTSLEGAPQRIGENFSCADNQLISLEGGPRIVGGFFNCSDNSLTSLEGAPQSVGGGLHFDGNTLSERSIRAVLKEMYSNGVSLEQAVTDRWKYILKEDRPYLASHHLGLSPDEKDGYAALLRLKTRVI
jgi:hypothetical protein